MYWSAVCGEYIISPDYSGQSLFDEFNVTCYDWNDGAARKTKHIIMMVWTEKWFDHRNTIEMSNQKNTKQVWWS